ncbi:MAG: site-2 protease family protein [Bacteroidales bacterium]
MKYSMNLGRPFGIKVSIHWTFLLLIAWVVIVALQQGGDFQQVVMYVIFILALFVCVTLHEFGHSLAARRYGIETKSITLLPIGRMANIKGMPEKPREEIIVTLSGLIVNVVIAGLIWGIIATTGSIDMDMQFEKITAKNFFLLLMVTNLFIVAFNLIPAFPMDGGRILRAALSLKMNRRKATRAASITGQFFGIVFTIGGLFINPFLVIIGIFVFLGARAEYEQEKYKYILGGYKVTDVMMHDFSKFNKNDQLKDVVKTLLDSQEEGFVVVENGEEVAGLLTKDDIISGLSKYGEEGKVEDAMNATFESLDPGMDLQKALGKMQFNKYKFLPVTDSGKLKGVVDLNNIQEFVMVKSALKGSEE